MITEQLKMKVSKLLEKDVFMKNIVPQMCSFFSHFRPSLSVVLMGR